jgi:hypothetical protein
LSWVGTHTGHDGDRGGDDEKHGQADGEGGRGGERLPAVRSQQPPRPTQGTRKTLNGGPAQLSWTTTRPINNPTPSSSSLITPVVQSASLVLALVLVEIKVVETKSPSCVCVYIPAARVCVAVCKHIIGAVGCVVLRLVGCCSSERTALHADRFRLLLQVPVQCTSRLRLSSLLVLCL